MRNQSCGCRRPASVGSEREGKITHVPVVSLLVPLPHFVSHQPLEHPDARSTVTNRQ